MKWMMLTRMIPSRIAAIRQSTFLRESALFGTSTMAEQGSRLATNLFAAAILGPTVWGYWFLLNLVLRYGALVHLGAINGMNREIPAALGRGDGVDATCLQRSAFGFVLVSFATTAGLLLLGSPLFGDAFPLHDLALTIVLLAFQQTYGFAVTSLKARIAFSTVSRMQWASTLVFPMLVIPAASAGGLTGYIMGQIGTYALLSLLALSRDAAVYVPAFNAAITKRLIGIGFPIMMVGVAHALFSTTDRWIIAALLDHEALGHYAIAIMAVGAIRLVPYVFAQQVYPRMAYAWAARRDVAELQRLAQHQALLALIAATAVTIPTAAVGPWAVRTLLPAYEAGIPALLVSLLAPLVAVLGQGFANVLNVIGKQQVYLVLIVVGAGVNVIVSLLLVDRLALVGIAVGTVAGFAFLSVGLLVTGARALRRLSRRESTSF